MGLRYLPGVPLSGCLHRQGTRTQLWGRVPGRSSPGLDGGFTLPPLPPDAPASHGAKSHRHDVLGEGWERFPLTCPPLPQSLVSYLHVAYDGLEEPSERATFLLYHSLHFPRSSTLEEAQTAAISLPS